MDPASAPVTSVSARLSEPFTSTAQLLETLVPPLISLDLVDDLPPNFVSRFNASPSNSIEPSKFVKRQLGLVQRVLLEKVWPDWENAVGAEEGKAGLDVFERWFIPLRGSDSAAAAKMCMCSYAVLSSVLSSESASKLPIRSLEIASLLLVKLNSAFSLSEAYFATLASSTRNSIAIGVDSDEEEDERIDPTSLVAWEQTTKVIFGIPVRVANAWGIVSEKQGTRVGDSMPDELEIEIYTSSLTSSFFSLIWRLSSPSTSTPFFPSALSAPLKSLLASSSFLTTSLSLLLPRILPPSTFPTPAEELIRRQKYINLLRRTIAELSDRDSSRLLRSLLGRLTLDLRRTEPNDPSVTAKSVSFVLSTLYGALDPNASSSTWNVALEVLLDRNCMWDSESVPQIVTFWLEGNQVATSGLLNKVRDVWGSNEEMKSAFETRRTYLTSLLLVLIAALPPMHPSIVSLSRSPLFLRAVSSSLSTVSPLSRLLGMLVAEYVSNRSVDPGSGVAPLDFGSTIWDGDETEKEKIRGLRSLFERVEQRGTPEVLGWKELLNQVYVEGSTTDTLPKTKPRPRENTKPVQPTSVEEPVQPRPKRPLISIISSDDELEGGGGGEGGGGIEELKPYPLPPAPSPATLDALSSSDPSLYQSAYSNPSTHPSQSRRRGKLRPPVYIFELTEYLRGKDPDGGSNGQKKEEADQEAERVEMALKEGEALIRRKSGWGHELKENAVNLSIALMSLQDNYELEQFEQLRQNLLVALIVGCPVEVAPCVIEHYFLTSYSISHLHTLLTSLALAARELAHLPIPSVPRSAPAPTPQPLFPSKQLPSALHRRLLGSQPEDQLQVLTADLTNLALTDAREDAETTLPGAAREKLLSVRRFNSKSSSLSRPSPGSSTPSYTTLCAEYFILPLLNRFWLYLRDTATSTLYNRSPSASTKGPYAGGASSTPILQPLLLSKYLATVSVLLHAARHAPTFLAVLAPEALALVVSLRPPSSSYSPSSSIRDDLDPGEVDQDLVLSAEMELVLLILSSSHALDSGHTLTRSSFELLSEAQSWAEEVFELEERKSGGAAVGRSGRAAAGVLLRLEEILTRWRGRVGWE